MNEKERWEQVYDQINGGYQEGCWDGIWNEAGPDGCIGPLVEQIYSARDRLCERTGISPDADPDLEELLDGFECLCRVCGKLMYHYGRQENAPRSE